MLIRNRLAGTGIAGVDCSTVHFLGSIDYHLFFLIVMHSRRELADQTIFADCRNEHIRSRGFPVNSLNVGIKLFYGCAIRFQHLLVPGYETVFLK